MLTSVAGGCIFIFTLIYWFVHEENSFHFVEYVLSITNHKDSARLYQLVDSIARWVGRLVFLDLLVYDNALVE